MIIICEPNCRDHSHETFNLGFIHGARKSWPNDEILVLADKSHCRTLLENAKHFPADLSNVLWGGIITYLHADFMNVLWNFFLIWKVLQLACRKRARSVMFLSATLVQQRIIKYFMNRKKYQDIIITINLHGELDKLAYPNFTILEINDCLNIRSNIGKESFVKRLWKNKGRLHRIFVSRLASRLSLLWDKFGAITFPCLDLRATLLQGNTKNIRYVCLADHVSKNLEDYIDVKSMNLRTIILPAVFRHVIPPVDNHFLKVATFGYGHSAMLYKLNCALEKKDIHGEYEIRVIGMDGRGIEGFSHVTQPINRVLTRQEMERLAEDIDMFLILYERERYILSCSGSIIEAHQYGKPILYLKNPCMDAFNTKGCPIGIACKNVDEMAQVLAEMIDNYQYKKWELLKYRNNIIQQREKIDINNNLERMRTLLQ